MTPRSALAERLVPAPEPALLNLFAVFHLNLAFSSIEESERATVIDRCYWPLLALVYNSPSRNGQGRAGSTLYRIRVRRRSTQ